MKTKLDHMHHHSTQLDVHIIDLERAALILEEILDQHEGDDVERASAKLLEEMVDAQVATAKCMIALSDAMRHHMAIHHGVPTPA